MSFLFTNHSHHDENRKKTSLNLSQRGSTSLPQFTEIKKFEWSLDSPIAKQAIQNIGLQRENFITKSISDFKNQVDFYNYQNELFQNLVSLIKERKKLCLLDQQKGSQNINGQSVKLNKCQQTILEGNLIAFLNSMKENLDKDMKKQEFIKKKLVETELEKIQKDEYFNKKMQETILRQQKKLIDKRIKLTKLHTKNKEKLENHKEQEEKQLEENISKFRERQQNQLNEDGNFNRSQSLMGRSRNYSQDQFKKSTLSLQESYYKKFQEGLKKQEQEKLLENQRIQMMMSSLNSDFEEKIQKQQELLKLKQEKVKSQTQNIDFKRQSVENERKNLQFEYLNQYVSKMNRSLSVGMLRKFSKVKIQEQKKQMEKKEKLEEQRIKRIQYMSLGQEEKIKQIEEKFQQDQKRVEQLKKIQHREIKQNFMQEKEKFEKIYSKKDEIDSQFKIRQNQIIQNEIEKQQKVKYRWNNHDNARALISKQRSDKFNENNQSFEEIMQIFHKTQDKQTLIGKIKRKVDIDDELTMRVLNIKKPEPVLEEGQISPTQQNNINEKTLKRKNL